MRAVAVVVLWLVATAMLAVAVPVSWAQRNLIDGDGYAAVARQAAADPALQAAVATQLTSAARTLIDAHGYDVDPTLVGEVATAYTGGSSFPLQFAQANRAAHDWLFARGGAQTDWVVDLAPMLSDHTFRQLLSSYQTEVPSTLTMPLTASGRESLRHGQLHPMAASGRWVAIGATVLAAVLALLTLLVARDRARALTGLGISALLVGAGGWVGIEVSRRTINAALNQTAGDIRQIADIIVAYLLNSLHQWLGLTLGAGTVLTVLGTALGAVGGLRRS